MSHIVVAVAGTHCHRDNDTLQQQFCGNLSGGIIRGVPFLCNIMSIGTRYLPTNEALNIDLHIPDVDRTIAY
jgi:hypothetical protein